MERKRERKRKREERSISREFQRAEEVKKTKGIEGKAERQRQTKGKIGDDIPS